MSSGDVERDELQSVRVLVTGAGGMLGRAFCEALPPSVDLIALDHAALDVTVRSDVLALAAAEPDVILHCAGMALADECERNPAEARRVHVDGTRHVSELALRTGARVFYPQSVFIFDGRELPVTEETEPAPPFVYGRMKLEAERHLLHALPDALVVRMAGFFGGDDRDKNFVGQLLRTMQDLDATGGGTLPVGDRVWQPTYTLDLARNTLLLLARGRTGVYHMGSIGEASFFDVAAVCVDELGLQDVVELVPETSATFEAAEPARRPMRMVTANRRLEAEGLCRQRPWEDALREYLRRPYFATWRR